MATDNGDPACMTSYASTSLEAFNGLCLVIVRAKKVDFGDFVVIAKSAGLDEAKIKIERAVH